MARVFDGDISNRLLALSAPVTSSPVTLAGWVRPANASLLGLLFGLTANDTDGWLGLPQGFYLEAGNPHLNFQTTNASIGGTATASNAFTSNVWTHCAGVRASTSSAFAYADGVEGTELTTTVGDPPGIDVVTCGADTTVTPGNVWGGGGRLAELGFWNVALTAVEIAELAAGASPLMVRPQSLQAYYPLHGRYGKI